MATPKNFPNHFFLLGLTLLSCNSPAPDNTGGSSPAAENRPDPCDNPDADIDCYFLNMPAALTSTMTICGPDEPGERLLLSGTVFHADGRTPYPDVIIYAYHTDNKGYYSKSGNETGVRKWHGRLHGWCRTGPDGRYEIRTIRPAPYPNGTDPAHIHTAVKKPGDSRPIFITDFVFSDDPLVSEKERSNLEYPGGTGIVDVVKSPQGVWSGKRDLVLP